MQTTLSTIDFATRLVTGIGCGALIGVERQWRARMAGLRTNALVAAGATLFVLYSDVVGDPNSPTRVASYVVSGVGFLGAGVIMRDGANVRGLNTAATLWCSAAAGVLSASGRIPLALIGTLAVVAIHLVLRPASRLIDRAPQGDDDTGTTVNLHLSCDRRAEAHIRALLIQVLSGTTAQLSGLRLRRVDDDTTTLKAVLALGADPNPVMDAVIGRLSLEPGISDLHWHRTDQEEQPAPGRDALV
ncbi:MgtC/SapB family protein [Streptomyces sp. NPDC001941]|uniref:MgtC/SapB family protein n=1 Tax=Streptomyces sp. NPDC001941 TaxID=3154659 RepID=UPI0033281FCD